MKKRSTSVFYYYYDKTFGFNTNEFNGGCQSPAIRLRNGKFSFSSLDGLVQFDPEKVPAYFPPNYITISALEIRGNLQDYTSDTLILPAPTKEVKISLSTPYYGHPDNFVMEYRMERDQDSWEDISKTRVISLYNLPPGLSRIEVRVRTGFGEDDFRAPLKTSKYSVS